MFRLVKKKIESILFSIIRRELKKRNIKCVKEKESIKHEPPLPYKFIESCISKSNEDVIINKIEKTSKIFLIYQRHLENYEVFFESLSFIDEYHITNLQEKLKEKILLLHGQMINWRNFKVIAHACENNCVILFSEDGFLSSVTRTVDFTVEKKFRLGCSLIIDKSAHFDCSKISKIEETLNSDKIYTEKEIRRAEECIAFILKNYISKYNNQPIRENNYSSETKKKKILVVDQAINDFSISLGGCNKDTFIRMLKDAIVENPGCEIYIKVHPDMIHDPKRGGQGENRFGHFTNINLEEYGKNVHLIKEYQNPIALIKSVDKVYVATSQLGFEALMCNKKVVIYGIPYYAGWGIGDCRNSSKVLQRRTKKRTVAEIFHVAYIESSIYINPAKGKRCEIEETLNFLLDARTEFFDQQNAKHTKIKNEDSGSAKETIIPVAFCFNEKYRRQAIVAIWSLLHSNQENKVKYRIYCVCENCITDIKIKEIENLLERNPNLESITFLRDNEYFKEGYECRGITKTAYIRLMLHRILEKERKVIYSDVDVLFRGSLRELYETELFDYCIGACIDVGLNDPKRYHSLTTKNKYWNKYLWHRKGRYYSSGILLLNLDVLRKLNKDTIIKDLSKCELPYQDMDIINIVYGGKITSISSKYCVIPRYLKIGYDSAANKGILPLEYAKDTKNPLIYHFAGKKPWDKKFKVMDIWWNYVKKYPELKALF